MPSRGKQSVLATPTTILPRASVKTPREIERLARDPEDDVRIGPIVSQGAVLANVAIATIRPSVATDRDEIAGPSFFSLDRRGKPR